MREIRIRLLWHKQAQFAGYLLAEQLGLARHAGVSIVCQGLDPSSKHVNAVLAGHAEMAVASPAHMIECSDPDALRWVLAIQQESPLVYPARQSDGVRTLADMRGRTAGVWPGHEALELRWMLRHAGLTDADVRWAEMPDTVGPFLRGEISLAQMTCYHELQQITDEVPADDLVIFDAKASGASILKDGLIVSAGLVRDEPGAVQAVVDAVLEGWTIAFDEPERAIAACLAARPGRTRAEEAAQLSAIRELAMSGATLTHGLGFPDPAHLAGAAQALRDVEGASPPTDGLRDARFWEAAPAVWRRVEWSAGA